MIIEFTLSKEDLFNLNFYVGWASPDKKSYRIKYYLKSILWPVLAALFILITIDKKQSADIWFTCVGLSLFIGFVGAYISVHSIYRGKIEKAINDPNNSNLFSKTELIITDNGITNRDEFAEVNYNWNAITKKAETNEYIYLFLNSVNAIVIPKKILSHEDRSQLSEILSKNLSLKAEFNELYPV